jgi:hypothetical protein
VSGKHALGTTCALAFVALASVGCSASDLRALSGDRAAYQATDTMGVRPAQPVLITLQTRPLLVENSAATLSHTQPGVWFTVNDSGNDPFLFALDTTGADRGMWRVTGASNVDWEAASVGPCSLGAADSSTARRGCVYIGDVGDNQARRKSRAIYQVVEPKAQAPGFSGTVEARRLRYRYSDGPHDVEAMYVAPNGDTYLLTKRRLVGASGRLRPSLLFRLSKSDWEADSIVVAAIVDSLPIVPGSAPMRQVTDAALSPDGRNLAVRTYAQIYVFATDSITGRVRGAIPPAVCNIVGTERSPGEGVAWYGRTGKLMLTAEGLNSPLSVVDCPMPRSEP